MAIRWLRNRQRLTGKNGFLSLGEAASKFGRGGRSLATLQKYDAPPESVTTADALAAYSLGVQHMVVKGDYAAGVPLFQRAIDLDPNFAMAYLRMGTSYFNLGLNTKAEDGCARPYQYRDRGSDREKFIASHSRFRRRQSRPVSNDLRNLGANLSA